MAKIKKLKDNNNNTIYPMTQASAVFLNNEERLSDYYLIKDMVASNRSVSDLFNYRTYFNNDGIAIKDPALYLVKIKVNGQQQLAYLENPINGCINTDFDNTGFLNMPLMAVNFTDGKIYTSTKEFSFSYTKEDNSAGVETGQNDLISSLEWTSFE